MQVYIEYVIIDNLIIDFILLKLSLKLSKVKSSFFKLLTGALVGTAIAVIMPFIKLNALLTFLIKILSAFLIVVVSGTFSRKKDYFLSVLYFVLATFLCGGFIISLFYFANIDYKIFFNAYYDSFLPISLSVVLVYIFSFLLNKAVKYLLKEKSVFPFYKKCVIITASGKYKINGYVDSGNLLTDVKTGLPIIVTSKKLSESLLKQGALKNLIGSVEYQTVSGIDTMYIYSIKKLIIVNGLENLEISGVLLGIGKVNFMGEYDLLLNPLLF